MRKDFSFLVKASLAIIALMLLTCTLPPLGDFPGDTRLAAIAAKGAAAPAYDPGQAGPYAVGHSSLMLYDDSRPYRLKLAHMGIGA